MSDTVLARVTRLADGIRQRAEEIEEARRLPEDLVKELTDAGALRMLVPAANGGPELALPDALRVVEALARADASTGWTVGQITLAQLIIGSFPTPARDAVYATGPDTLGAGAVAPKGRAVHADGSYRVSGQWPYVTGCWYASWVYLTCVVMDGRAVRLGPDGTPQTCMALLPAEDVEILDTWDVLGMRGTASHDVRVPGRTSEHTLFLAGDDPAALAVRYRIAQAGLLIGATNVGLAQGALDDVIAVAEGGKRPAFSRRRLAESPMFQDRLGEAQVTLAAARALLYAQATETATGPVDRATLRAVVAKVAALTTSTVDTAHALAGGSSVYRQSSLQRRLRDMHTSSQHFVNGRDHYGLLGALLAGADIDPAMV